MISMGGVIAQTLRRLHGQWGLIGLMGLLVLGVMVGPQVWMVAKTFQAELASARLPGKVEAAAEFYGKQLEKRQESRFLAVNSEAYEVQLKLLPEEERVFATAELATLQDETQAKLFSEAMKRHLSMPLSEEGQRIMRMWSWAQWPFSAMLAALMFGLTGVMLTAVRGGDLKFGGLMAWFAWRRWLRAVVVMVLFWLYVLAWALLGLAPGVGLLAVGAPAWIVQSVIMVPVIYALVTYQYCVYILQDKPELGARAALQRSKALMKGQRWEFLRVFVPLYLLTVVVTMVTCGVMAIWLFPFLIAAQGVFYDELREKGK